MKLVPRAVLALCMIGAGVTHLRAPDGFVRTVPEFLPAPGALVFISGVCEILGGVGLVLPFSRRWAAWGLIALYIAVAPANLNMAMNHIGFGGKTGLAWLLWARLPGQVALIAWAHRYTLP